MRRVCFPVLPLLLLALSISACSRQARDCGSSCSCFTSDDCPSDNICFLGTCQSAGYNIETVYIDLMPSTASGYLAQPDQQNPRDLSRGLDVTIQVLNSTLVNGQVNAGGTALGGLITAVVHPLDPNAVVLPSLQTVQQGTIGSSMAFNLTLLPVPYDITLQPTQGATSPNTVLPPLYLTSYNPSTAELSLTYPFANLVALTGTVVAQPNTLTPVTGAQITGTALDANGGRMVAAPATTDPNGAYTLQYLPGGTQFTVTTHPGSSATGNPLVPVMTFAVTPNGNTLGTQALDIPAIGVNITAHVQDPNGNPVGGTSVLFSGSVGTPSPPAGVFTASGTTNSLGQATVTLLAGNYNVSVLPASSQTVGSLSLGDVCVATSGASGETCVMSVADGGTVSLSLEGQITAAGTVTDSTGVAVSGARVQYSTYVGSSNRTFAANTDPNGNYTVLIDPGTVATAASYELSVEPGQNSGVPRYRELLRVGTTSFTHNVQIYAASFVYGTVLDPNGNGLNDVTIALYSADLGSAGQPLLIGLGKSTSGGEFAIPIPTAN